jgi:adenylate cyclase class 2
VKVEIEAKMPLTDPEAFEALLKERGAQRGPRLLEINSFFDTPEAVLKASDQGLRLRVEQDEKGRVVHTTITHKGPRAHGKLKSREEIEVEVHDGRAAAELLTALGYSPVFVFEKRRQLWELDGCIVAVDQLPRLGWFVEIEGDTETHVMAARERLGLAGVSMLPSSYISMLTTHLLEAHSGQTEVRFEDDSPRD